MAETKSKKGLKFWLGLSAMLNVFMVGCGIGVAIIATQHKQLPGAEMQGLAMDQVTEGLTSPVAKQVKDTLTQAALSGETYMQTARGHRQMAISLLVTPKPDIKGAQAQMSLAKTYEIMARDKVETSIIGLMGDLSPYDRAVVAERLIKSPMRIRKEALKASQTELKRKAN
jgi:uncharacterized membrane protein